MTDGWRDSTHERTDSHVLVAILRDIAASRFGDSIDEAGQVGLDLDQSTWTAQEDCKIRRTRF
jgi:hypothetical protein